MRLKSFKASQLSNTSSRAKGLEARAKCAELETRLAQLDYDEAPRKEARRVRLITECTASNAVSKVYKSAIKEDNEKYLGSDEPDGELDKGTHCQIGREGEQGSEFKGFSLSAREPNSQIALA